MPKNKVSVLSSLRYFDALPDSAHVRLPVVEALFACSAPSVWRGVRAGRIPAPRKISAKITAWPVGALRAALAALSKESSKL